MHAHKLLLTDLQLTKLLKSEIIGSSEFESPRRDQFRTFTFPFPSKAINSKRKLFE